MEHWLHYGERSYRWLSPSTVAKEKRTCSKSFLVFEVVVKDTGSTNKRKRVCSAVHNAEGDVQNVDVVTKGANDEATCKIGIATVRPCSRRAKANGKTKTIKEQAKESKEKKLNMDGNFRFPIRFRSL